MTYPCMHRSKAKYSSNPFPSSVLERVGLSAPRPDRFTPGNEPVPIVEEAGWVSWPVWTGTENICSASIRSPDRRYSESLYRLSYPGRHLGYEGIVFVTLKLCRISVGLALDTGLLCSIQVTEL